MRCAGSRCLNLKTKMFEISYGICICFLFSMLMLEFCDQIVDYRTRTTVSYKGTARVVYILTFFSLKTYLKFMSFVEYILYKQWRSRENGVLYVRSSTGTMIIIYLIKLNNIQCFELLLFRSFSIQFTN